MNAQLKRIRRFLRRRWPAVAAIALAAGLLVLFLLYSRSSGPVQVYPAFSTPVSSEMIGVPRFVGGPTDLARDFAWRQALVLVEIETVAPMTLGTVIDQFPLPQMLIRAGDTLTVTVSLGTAGEALPTDARVGGRVPLRLTPIGMATAAVRQTQTARRANERAAAAALISSPATGTVGATPTDSDAVATRRASEAARDAGATRTVTATATLTGTLAAPASTATASPPSPAPSAIPSAVGTRPPPEPTREPLATSAPEPTEVPDPPEPPTPPPPPPEAQSSGPKASTRERRRES